MIESLVQKELQRLDPDLFLDKLWVDGTLVWTIRYNIGSGEEPLTPVVWMDGAGRPLSLSLSIVDRLKGQEGSIVEALNEVKARNKAKSEAAMVEAAVLADEIAREHQFEGRNKKISVPVTRMRREQHF
jgi:hypothetical protein